MNIKVYKNYFSFIISIAIFIVIIGYSLFVYMKWNVITDEKNKSSVEVNLPVINWDKYSNLSKKFENDNISKE